jgi:hypothetical protein
MRQRRLSFICALAAAVLATSPVHAQAPIRTADGEARATPALLDMRAWSVGTGLAAGAGGVELLRRRDLRHGVGLGVGVGGLGARVFATPFEAVGRVHTWVPYASFEALYAPWRWGDLDAPGGIGYAVGLQHWGEDRDWFGDVGIGAAHTRAGAWFGRRTLPVLRVALGRGRPF